MTAAAPAAPLPFWQTPYIVGAWPPPPPPVVDCLATPSPTPPIGREPRVVNAYGWWREGGGGRRGDYYDCP